MTEGQGRGWQPDDGDARDYSLQALNETVLAENGGSLLAQPPLDERNYELPTPPQSAENYHALPPRREVSGPVSPEAGIERTPEQAAARRQELLKVKDLFEEQLRQLDRELREDPDREIYAKAQAIRAELARCDDPNLRHPTKGGNGPDSGTLDIARAESIPRLERSLDRCQEELGQLERVMWLTFGAKKRELEKTRLAYQKRINELHERIPIQRARREELEALSVRITAYGQKLVARGQLQRDYRLVMDKIVESL